MISLQNTKRLFFTLLLTVGFLSNTAPALLSAPAVTSTWILNDGTEVLLPSYFDVSSGVAIIGIVDADALWELQRGMNTYVPVEIFGKGLCLLWLLEYSSETDLGAYHEVAFAHLARRNGATLNLDIDLSDVNSIIDKLSELMSIAFVYDALWLDNDLGIAAGEQIWGHPKLKAQFDESSVWWFGRKIRRVITITDTLSGLEVLHACLPVLRLNLPGSPLPPFTGVTPGDWWDINGPQQYSMSFNSIDSIAVQPWNPLVDRLFLGQGTPQLDMLHDLNFIPIGIMDYHGFEIICSEPTGL